MTQTRGVFVRNGCLQVLSTVQSSAINCINRRSSVNHRASSSTTAHRCSRFTPLATWPLQRSTSYDLTSVHTLIHFTDRPFSHVAQYIIVRPLSTVEYTSVAKSKNGTNNLHRLTERDSMLAHLRYFGVWGILLGYIATSGAKSDIFLIGNPDFI